MKGDIRCVDGRRYRHDPQFDDPELETDVGQCPDCEGEGCHRPCPVCGNEERGQGGYLSCECPAPLPIEPRRG